MSYRSRVFYTGTGSSQNLSVTFPYLDITHVHVYFDDVLQEDNTWSWVTTSTIALTAPTGAIVEIRRSTPLDPMVTFTNSSLLNEDDQNMAALQAIYLIEEGTDGFIIIENIVDGVVILNKRIAITYVIDEGGGVLSAGEKGHIVVPFACTLVEAYLVADQPGSMVVDVWAADYADFPPANADSITLDTPLTLVGADKLHNSALTGWTKNFSDGAVFAFNVDSCTTITRATVVLVVTKE